MANTKPPPSYKNQVQVTGPNITDRAPTSGAALGFPCGFMCWIPQQYIHCFTAGCLGRPTQEGLQQELHAAQSPSALHWHKLPKPPCNAPELGGRELRGQCDIFQDPSDGIQD